MKTKLIADDKIDDFLKPKKERTQSQKVKDILFVYWQKKKIDMDSETFYNLATDAYIESVKQKIKELEGK